MLQFQSPNDYQGSLALSRYQLRVLPKLFIIIWGLCCVPFILLNRTDLKSVISTTIIYLIFLGISGGIFYLFSYFCLLPWAVKGQIKSIKFCGDNIINIYNLGDDGSIAVTTMRDGEKCGEILLKYDDIYKCVTYKEYIFIFFSKVQAFVIKKTNLEDWQTAEIQNWGTKYKKH